MKKPYFILKPLALVVYLGSVNLVAQDIAWEQTYGGKHADYLFDVQPTVDYGFILAGSSLSGKTGNKNPDNIGDLDYWIWKMDEEGKPNWQKSFGGPGSDMLQSIRHTSDGGFILAGTSESQKGFHKKDSCRGGSDYWIIKLDAQGGEQWQKTLGGSSREELQTILQTRDGGYIIGGSSSSEATGDKTQKSRGNLDFWIVKLDSKGTIEWQKTLGGKYADILRSLEQTTDGGYIAGGYSNSPESGDKTQPHFGAGDYWIVKLSASGAIEWQQTLGGEGDDQLQTVHQTLDGNYIAAGHSNSGATHTKSKTNRKGTDLWLVKFNEKGIVLWQETYNFAAVDILTSLLENPDGTLLIGAYARNEDRSKGSQKNTDNYIALKLSPEGRELWTRSVGSKGEDILAKAIETRDGGYLLAGTSKGAAAGDKNKSIGSQDFWVVKLKDRDKPVKEKAAIEAVPNPTRQFTNIVVGYDFREGTASVFDLAGRQLQHFPITERIVPVDLGGLPQGIYIVEIKTDVQQDAVKVIKGVTKG